MPINQYAPFATLPGAHVISNDDYTNLAARGVGFIDGVAIPEQVNKVWRQSSVWSYLLGAMVTQFAGVDALDDGNPSGLYPGLIAAIQNLGGGAAAVSSVFGRSGPITAQNSDYSAFYDPLGAAATAQTNAQTASNAFTAGYASDAGHLSTGSVDPARLGAGIPASKIAGGTLDNTEWGYLSNVTSDVQTQLNARPVLSLFDYAYSGASGQGHVRIPVASGGQVILQWGQVPCFKTVTVGFDLHFPTACVACVAQTQQTSAAFCTTRLLTPNSFTIDCWDITGNLTPASGFYTHSFFAVGF